jgi:hypothetical protein
LAGMFLVTAQMSVMFEPLLDVLKFLAAAATYYL